MRVTDVRKTQSYFQTQKVDNKITPNCMLTPTKASTKKKKSKKNIQNILEFPALLRSYIIRKKLGHLHHAGDISLYYIGERFFVIFHLFSRFIGTSLCHAVLLLGKR